LWFLSWRDEVLSSGVEDGDGSDEEDVEGIGGGFYKVNCGIMR
jgi:hypothetical protein